MELKEIIQHFLGNWEHADVVDGVLLTGSRSAGTHAENSDIDLQVLFSDDTLRERGNQIVDGYLVEYFANPTSMIEAYLRKESEQFHRPTLRMFATGTIFMDKSGSLERAKMLAVELLKTPLPTMLEAEVEAAKYSIWDCRDDLLALYENNDPSFLYVYHLNLNKVLTLYSRFCGGELTSASKQFRQMSDSRFREKYEISDYPDQLFQRLFCSCMTAQTYEDCFGHFSRLVEHALSAMGGFEIDGWRLSAKV